MALIAAQPSNTAATAQPLSAVVGMVKGWVERCGWIWTQGQIIELRRRTGVIQFLTLRDPHSEISATITCTSAVLDAAGPLVEGSTVVALVTPRVWPQRASLSFEAREIQVAGEGQLLAELERRKRKLQAEGLFDPIRKKPLPFLPRRIGLITGAGSAAERDVLTNIKLRWPAADIVVRHALVQGPLAAQQVIEQLQQLDGAPGVEVIIIARGGGSLEDLLPFSDEGLVRAVAAARTPIVSAIGHEPDTPIIDLAADLRASTPTDAAKRVVPDAAQEALLLSGLRDRLRTAVTARLDREQQDLDRLRSRPVLRDPIASFSGHYEQLASMRLRLAHAIDRRLSTEASDITHALSRVRAMSPKATLERGYAILAGPENRSVTSIRHTKPGDQLQAYLQDGTLLVGVNAVVPTGRPSDGSTTPKPSQGVDDA